MTVVRYTFDVCLRDRMNEDTYTKARRIEEAILKCDGVCGCEYAYNADNRGYNSVNVNEAIEWQRNHRKWLGEKEGGAA